MKKEKGRGFAISYRTASMISSLIYIILGLVLVLRPGSSLIFLCRLVGWAGLVMGLVGIVYGFFCKKDSGKSSYGLLGGGIALSVLGIFLIANPGSLANLVPTIIGVVILVNGLMNLVQTWWLRSIRFSRNGSFLLALATIILGFVIMAHPFGVGSVLIMVTGVILIYNGLSNIWVMTRFEEDMRKPKYF